MEVRSLLVRFENLNRSFFQSFLTSVNSPSMEEHISGMLWPGTWGNHIEPLAGATYYNIPVYYCCHNARKGDHWELCKPLHNPNVVFDTQTLLEVRWKLFYHLIVSKFLTLSTANMTLSFQQQENYAYIHLQYHMKQ